jgi:hypothetical protein
MIRCSPWTRHALRLAVLSLGAACTPEATSNVPVLDDSNRCLNAIQPVVSDSVRGGFTWSPGCGLHALTVSRQRVDNPFSWEDVWFLQPWTKLVFPPIAYGSSPSGAIAPLNATPPVLEPGRTYRVTVGFGFYTNPYPSVTWTVP